MLWYLFVHLPVSLVSGTSNLPQSLSSFWSNWCYGVMVIWLKAKKLVTHQLHGVTIDFHSWMTHQFWQIFCTKKAPTLNLRIWRDFWEEPFPDHSMTSFQQFPLSLSSNDFLANISGSIDLLNLAYTALNSQTSSSRWKLQGVELNVFIPVCTHWALGVASLHVAGLRAELLLPGFCR